MPELIKEGRDVLVTIRILNEKEDIQEWNRVILCLFFSIFFAMTSY